jgi:hypothetical protein
MVAVRGGHDVQLCHQRLPFAGRSSSSARISRADDYDRIVPSLTVVPLRLKQILHHPGIPIRDIYFPADGFRSELTVLNDDRMVEVATIGREEVVGLLGGSGRNPVRSATMLQGPGAGGHDAGSVFSPRAAPRAAVDGD